MYIKVPVGTLIINDETGEIIADLVKPNQKLLFYGEVREEEEMLNLLLLL